MSSNTFMSIACAITTAFILALSQPARGEAARPLHDSVPSAQTHQYLTGEAAHIWPGTHGQALETQYDWTMFFTLSHHEIWEYVGARTEYYNIPLSNPTIWDGIITYGGRYGDAPVTDVLWTPPDAEHDVPYSEFDASVYNAAGPLFDPISNDDGSGSSDGNLTVGSWPSVGDDIIEGAHEEDTFFIHEVFTLLYDMYGSSAFNPASDYLDDEFYNGVDYDGAEAFYHHLWRRRAHNDSDIEMTGVSWSTSQSSWEECIVMPDIFDPHPSPIQVAEAYWQLAVDYYLGQNGRLENRGLAYYFLGRVAHLLADMSVPAHAHCDPHSPIWPDSYEYWMADVSKYSAYTHDQVPLFDASGTVVGVKPWTYTVGTWAYDDFDYVRNQIPGTKWDQDESDDVVARSRWEAQSRLFHLFWCTAEISDNFDSNDANGEVDSGMRRSGGFTEFELRTIGDTLMPQAMMSLAELYRLFCDTVGANELTHILLLAPADQSVLSSPPTLMWSTVGGSTNAFAVDASLTPGFSKYWSTYNGMGQIIYETRWTAPLSVWSRIPTGVPVYWRVRGVDLDHEPLDVVVSDEVWSFTKQ
ncbi:MAG: hypothetical protein Kow0099_28330 [Candidatus Abyssubacteria bacterium]